MGEESVKFIGRLSEANGVSGFEDDVLEVIRFEIEKDWSVSEDSLRNLYVTPNKNTSEKNAGLPVVMLDGHTDEVGFMVQCILPNGLLQFIPLGGWVPNNIPAHRVRVRDKNGKYHIGITGSKPPHFMGAGEKKKPLEIEDMYIDLGATCYEEVVNDFGIEIGAPVVPHVDFLYNERTGIISGKAFDDRLGCAAVIDTLKELSGDSLGVNLVGTLVSQEEVGLRGTEVATRKVKPDVAIVFEGTPADDVYKDNHTAQGVVGKGPQLRHRDNTMIANPKFVKLARGVAAETGIPYQDAVRTSGGTNGGKIHLSNEGVPTIVLGVPTRYAHTHYGYASIKDYKNTVKLAVEIIKRLDRKGIDQF